MICEHHLEASCAQDSWKMIRGEVFRDAFEVLNLTPSAFRQTANPKATLVGQYSDLPKV
jgi:hypothetical protein